MQDARSRPTAAGCILHAWAHVDWLQVELDRVAATTAAATAAPAEAAVEVEIALPRSMSAAIVAPPQPKPQVVPLQPKLPAVPKYPRLQRTEPTQPTAAEPRSRASTMPQVMILIIDPDSFDNRFKNRLSPILGSCWLLMVHWFAHRGSSRRFLMALIGSSWRFMVHNGFAWPWNK